MDVFVTITDKLLTFNSPFVVGNWSLNYYKHPTDIPVPYITQSHPQSTRMSCLVQDPLIILSNIFQFKHSCLKSWRTYTFTPFALLFQSLVIPEKFQHILRVMNTNIDGRRKVPFAMTAIKVGKKTWKDWLKTTSVFAYITCAPTYSHCDIGSF